MLLKFLLTSAIFIWSSLCMANDSLVVVKNRNPLNLPTSDYDVIHVDGFTVLVSPEFKKQSGLKQQVLRRLKTHLLEISKVVPSKRLNQLQLTKLWLEVNTNNNGSGEYHPSKQWLIENGYNPDKEMSIEINNAKNYLEWTQIDSNSRHTVLHELAHALHDQLSEEIKSEIKNQYQKVRKMDLYKDSPRKGNKIIEDAYALTDEWEYFAELSETILIDNDYFPNTKEELADYDSEGYKLVNRIWKSIEKRL